MRTIVLKLVLCSSTSIAALAEDGEYDRSRPESDRIHDHMVSKFRRALAELEAELELLDFKVFTEFYVDTLDDDDYQLSVGHSDLDEVQALVEQFHAAADAILTTLHEVEAA